MFNMKLVTFLAILTALTNTILVHSYTPDGVNLNMVPLIHTDINDRAAYKLTSDNGKFHWHRRLALDIKKRKEKKTHSKDFIVCISGMQCINA